MTAAATSFDRAARTYLRHAGVQEEMAEWLSEWLPTSRFGRALEIGAGPGLFTRRLLPWDGELVATDLSRAMCAAGREQVPQVTWSVMAAEAPDPGPWDWILCSSMLQWATDPSKVLVAWRDRLASDGRVLAGLFAAESLPEWTAIAGPGPLVWRTPADWRGFAEEAGLAILRDGEERRQIRYPSARTMLRSLHGVGAAPERRIPQGRLRRLLAEYEARHGHGNGVPATWTFYRLECRRK